MGKWKERIEGLVDQLRYEVASRRPLSPEQLGAKTYWEIENQADDNPFPDSTIHVNDALMERIGDDLGLSNRQITRFKQGYKDEFAKVEQIDRDFASYAEDRVWCAECGGMYLPHEH